MPDFIASATATPGLIWLIVAVLAAGTVRGFAGFGTAMIFLPVAAKFLSPFEAITALIAMDLIGPLPNMPRAFRDGHPPDVARLGLGMIIALPIGVFILTQVAPEVFRYGLSVITGLLLVMLIMGLRYSGTLSRPMVYGTGVVSGFLGGAVGVAGPPVIMLYMASENPPKVIRANITIYLLVIDIAMLAMFWLFGQLVASAFVLGLLLAVPYLLGNLLGAKMFRPEAERIYRIVAYAIIGVSALSGLPFLD
ncbi:MAG: sulfite exporter TauE/SafE family protein [Paracoccaceae bacterium]